MNLDLAINIFLPASLFLIMIGLGLSLSPKDFTRLIHFPKPVCIGIGCQLILLPAIAFLIAELANMGPELAMGLVIIALSPGGASSNFFTFLAKGDVALSITLTAFTSFIAIITVPLLIKLSTSYFFQEETAIAIPVSKTFIFIFVFILLPMILGMWIKAKRPAFAEKSGKLFRFFALFTLFLIIIAVLYRNFGEFAANFRLVGGAVIALMILAMSIGNLLARLFKLGPRQTKAITIEVGIQNGIQAITIAMSPLMLNNLTLAIPAIVYSVLMYLAVFLYLFLIRVSKKAST